MRVQKISVLLLGVADTHSWALDRSIEPEIYLGIWYIGTLTIGINQTNDKDEPIYCDNRQSTSEANQFQTCVRLETCANYLESLVIKGAFYNQEE